VYEDHLKSCEYCQKGLPTQTHNKPTIFLKSASSYSKDKKPTIYVKSASSYNKHKKMAELAAIIRGTSYPSLEPLFQTKGASSEVGRKPGPIEREVKLKELGKMVRGY
jgi:hypothetical protein